VYPRHHLGTRQHQDLVAALERRAAEVVGGEVGELQARTHGAVEDDHAAAHGVEIGSTALVHGQGAMRQHGV
jgi:hypothetical protein